MKNNVLARCSSKKPQRRTHRAEEVANRVEQVVEVRLVLVVIEATARVAERARLVVARRLKDEAGLEQDFADVAVDSPEPLAELGVIPRVVDERVDGVPNVVEGAAIRKALKERATRKHSKPISQTK